MINFLNDSPPSFICRSQKELSSKKLLRFFNLFLHSLIPKLFSLYKTKHIYSTNRFEIPLIRNNSTVDISMFPLDFHDLFCLLKRTFNNTVYSYTNNQGYTNSLTNSLTIIDYLQSLEHCIIFKADKSNAWVMLNLSDYIFEGHRQLSDKVFYRSLDKPVHTFASQRIIVIFRNLLKKGFITKKEFDYFAPPINYNYRYFYMLPKIHKPLNSWSNSIPPGRPIVSDVNTESSRAAKYIDYYLKPLVLHIKSYIRDTDHFIARMFKVNLTQSDFLFTLDINSLYTNISTSKGIEAVKKFFNLYPDVKRPSNSILTLLSICLTFNDFIFDNCWYLQTKGTAMGRKFAPNYSNIFLSFWEETILDSCIYKPKCWFRFIDDIFGVWPYGLFEFLNFVKFVNSIDPDIQVSFYIHPITVPFLDIYVHNFTGTFNFSSYIKPTHNLKILPPSSYHPKHIFKGIVKSIIHRLVRRNSTKHTFLQTLTTYFKVWKSQGYNLRFLRNCKYEVIHNFNVSFSWTFGFFKCNRDSCKYCTFGLFNNHFTHNQVTYRISKHITCNSLGCIYLIFCIVCDSFIYVGETGECLRLRIANHLSKIKTHSDTVISKHFNEPGHSFNDFRYIGIDFNIYLSKRRNLELKYIKLLKPLLNSLSSNLPPSINLTFPYSIKSNRLVHNLTSVLRNRNFVVTKSFMKADRNLKSILHRKF